MASMNLQDGLGVPAWDWKAAGDIEQYMTQGWSEGGNPMYKWSQYDEPPADPGDKTTSARQDTDVEKNLGETFGLQEERQPREHSSSISVFRLPVVGPLYLVQDTQGYIQAGVVLLYWIYGSWCTRFLVLNPHYYDEIPNVGYLWILWFDFVSIMCISSFIRAVTANPGRLPLRAKTDKPMTPEEHKENPGMSHCRKCVQLRPTDSHHCSRCDQCVKKMDHHCPWINNCVGEDNRFLFMLLVMYAMLLSLTVLVSLLFNDFVWPECQACLSKETVVMTFRKDLLIIAYILSVLMIILSGGLFFTQFCLVRFDMTTLDMLQFDSTVRASGKTPGWDSRPKAKRSCMATYRDLCGNTSPICWIFPCHRRSSRHLFSNNIHSI